MRITELSIAGAFLVDSTTFTDTRGTFETSWEVASFTASGIAFSPTNAHISFNRAKHTLRGLHYQCAPYAQSKLVYCVRGAVWDVMVDLRKESRTYLHWEATRIEAEAGRSIFVPGGCAHGFLTLAENSAVSYLIEGQYNPKAAATLRWNDPTVNIDWPTRDPVLSERDRNAPLLLIR